MNTQESATAFEQLFIAFPGFRDWLAKTKQPNETHAAWCQMLAHCEADDVNAIITKLIGGQLTMPAAYERDTLPVVIRREANQLRSERKGRERMDRYHVAATEAKTDSQRFGVAWRQAEAWGKAVRSGKTTKAENDDAVEQIIQWSHGRDELPSEPQ